MSLRVDMSSGSIFGAKSGDKAEKWFRLACGFAEVVLGET